MSASAAGPLSLNQDLNRLSKWDHLVSNVLGVMFPWVCTISCCPLKLENASLGDVMFPDLVDRELDMIGLTWVISLIMLETARSSYGQALSPFLYHRATH